jgi:HPt (histidine-containing phosphotransfer) domain-containing protein
MNAHLSKPINASQLRQVLAPYLTQAKRVTPQIRDIPNEKKAPLAYSVINVDEGLEQMGGNKELYVRLLREFIRQVHEEVMPSLEKNLPSKEATTEQWELFRSTIHCLKGVSGNLFLTELHHCATRVDAQIKQSQKAEQSAIDALYLSIIQTEDAIHQWLKE